MKLHHQDFGGSGRPIVILHGLFASSKNWTSVGRFLKRLGHPYALDARNHGDSPHAASHSFDDLIEDLDEWLADQGIQDPLLLGHSMGGLTVMGHALRYPGRAAAVIVVDIAPRPYQPDFQAEFDALSMDLSGYSSRDEIDRAMAEIVPDGEIRQFLQMNLERSGEGFRWKINTPVLRSSPMLSGPDFSGFDTTYPGPAMLVAGGDSPFVGEQDLPLFRRSFPQARIEVIPGCGHWLHFICSDQFQALLQDFIGGLDRG